MSRDLFVIAYVAISIPVIGEGLLANAAGLRAAGLVFVIVVAVLSAAARDRSCAHRARQLFRLSGLAGQLVLGAVAVAVAAAG